MDYRKMSYEDIKTWCVANKDKNAHLWLADCLSGNFTDGKKPTYIQIKNLFCRKYMPEIMPIAKPKKPPMFADIDYLRSL